LCIDWCTRTIGGPASESADLHDFAGGTWPWFEDESRAGAQGPKECIVMVSHHPMHDLVGGYGSFALAEMERIEALTGSHGDWVYANFAGHYHFDWVETRSAGGYQVVITDATWDDENTFRLVRVFEDSDTFSYEREIVALP
ncbi:MAG: metallophosphoesterase family protein, partial [Planctomycetota bacterium]